MGAWLRPQLPEGPLLRLNRELHRLHAHSGYRSSYQIAAWMKSRVGNDPDFPDGWTTPSHTSVHKVLTRPVLPNRAITITLVEALIALGRLPNGRAVIDHVEDLWAAAFEHQADTDSPAHEEESLPVAAVTPKTETAVVGSESQSIPWPTGEADPIYTELLRLRMLDSDNNLVSDVEPAESVLLTADMLGGEGRQAQDALSLSPAPDGSPKTESMPATVENLSEVSVAPQPEQKTVAQLLMENGQQLPVRRGLHRPTNNLFYNEDPPSGGGDEALLVVSRYRLLERLSASAKENVWKANDEVLGRTVMVKQVLLSSLKPDDAEDTRQRTMREGRIAARLLHRNAITVFDVVIDENDQPCLIMEYLNSTSLAEVLRERGTLQPQEVARIGAEVAAALKEAHRVGIVHRDIKPDNILLGGKGVVKITNFGISRAKDDITLTKPGLITGTPAYLAPEVAIGDIPGPESDIFSLGSTLYAASEGKPPFGLGTSMLDLLHRVAAGQINPPRQSRELGPVLIALLQREVLHRPIAKKCEELLAAVARGEAPLKMMP